METKYKLKPIDTLSEKILYGLFFCSSSVAAMFYSAFVFSKIWEYIIVSVFHVEKLSIAAAFGVSFFIGYLVNYKNPAVEVVTNHFNKRGCEISKWESSTMMTLCLMAYDSFILLTGYLISFLY